MRTEYTPEQVSAVRLDSITVGLEQDNDPDLSWLDQTAEQMGAGFEESARARKDAYNAGDWCMVGVLARAEIVVDGVCQTITSGGLWGVESDSDSSYFEELQREQVDELAGILSRMGVPDEEIADAR